MRTAYWKRMVRPLIPPEERWEFRDTLCYRAPVGRFLFGVLGEGSGFDAGIYVWRVSMPMFVPFTFINLSYSERVGGGARKYQLADAEALTVAIANGFRELPSETQELLRVIKIAQARPTLRRLEAVAYSYVLLGDDAGAINIISRAAETVTRYDWEADVVAQLSDLAAAIRERGIGAAMRKVDAQARQTAVALGVVRT